MPKFRGKHYYLGAWSYFFLSLLYAVPVIGFIFLLIHSFNTSNENLRHYARSYFVRLLVAVILLIAIFAYTYFAKGSHELLTEMNEIAAWWQHVMKLFRIR